MRKILLVILVALVLMSCEEVTRSASMAFDNANSAIKDKVFVPVETPTPTP